jgi:hypothetical protein
MLVEKLTLRGVVSKQCRRTTSIETSSSPDMPRRLPTPPSETANILTYYRLHWSHNATQLSHRSASIRGKPLANHGCRTNIRSRHSILKVTLPPLRRIDRTKQPRRTRDTKLPPKSWKKLLRSMKFLSAMNTEAAASTHNPHPGLLPRHPPTQTQEKPHTTAKDYSPRRCPQEGCNVDIVVPPPLPL